MKNLIIILLTLNTFISCGQKPITKIKVKISDSLYKGVVSGKLIFLFDKDTSSSVIFGVNPEYPHPVFTYDITNWNLGDTISITEFKDEWFHKFSELDGEYVCRVIFDADTLSRSSFVTKGNAYSKRSKHTFSKHKKPMLSFNIDNKFDGWVFNESEHIKEIKYRSSKLSSFWGKDMYLESAVILPHSYSKDKNYSVVYILPGFGSNHASITYGTGLIDRYGINTVGKEKIFIYLNAEFFQGYHHFVDSENNGPWGKALIEEFIPYIESAYCKKTKETKRFLIGQSSGAWTAIWLQVNYLDIFNGAFAGSPDPIDFRAHGFDIYKEESNYYFPENPDSIAILNGKRNRLYAELENVIGEYGQIRTWEATFSPKNSEGGIEPIFERKSGNISPDVAKHWSKYDISKLIQNNTDNLRNSISGKLHIYVSMDDPYELFKSIELFDTVLKDNKIKAEIEYFNGLGHFVWTDELRSKIHSTIDSEK